VVDTLEVAEVAEAEIYHLFRCRRARKDALTNQHGNPRNIDLGVGLHVRRKCISFFFF